MAAAFLAGFVMLSCEKEDVSIDTTRSEAVSEPAQVKSGTVRPDQVNIDYLHSADFQNQLNTIGWDNLQQDGLNLEVVAFDNVIQTNPFDPSEIPNPNDFVSVGIVIKIIIKEDGESGPWGGHHLTAGMYLLNTETGVMIDMTGKQI